MMIFFKNLTTTRLRVPIPAAAMVLFNRTFMQSVVGCPKPLSHESVYQGKKDDRKLEKNRSCRIPGQERKRGGLRGTSVSVKAKSQVSVQALRWRGSLQEVADYKPTRSGH